MKKFITVVLVLLVVLFVVVVNRGNQTGVDKNGQSAKSSVSDAKQSKEEEPAPTETEQDKAYFTYDQPQTIDDLKITIISANYTSSAGDLRTTPPAESGYTHLNVWLNVKNVGKEAFVLDEGFSQAYTFRLIYDGEYEYLSTWSFDNTFLQSYDSIPALGELTNKCVSFRIPVEVRDNKEPTLFFRVEANSIWDSTNIEWTLRHNVPIIEE